MDGERTADDTEDEPVTPAELDLAVALGPDRRRADPEPGPSELDRLAATLAT